MPVACAQRFEAGIVQMTEAAAAITVIGTKVDQMCVLMTGDGEPETGLVFRLASLEKAAKDAGRSRRRWKDRLWQILSGALLLLTGALIAAFCSGCMPGRGANEAVITPVATTEAPVTAEHIENLDQKLTQIQNTQSTQIQNYARDVEQAKTDRAINKSRARSGDKYFGALAAILAAFAVFGWCTERVLKGWRRDIALVAAGSLIAFAIAVVMVWPY